MGFGFLSSYAWRLLAVAFAQRRGLVPAWPPPRALARLAAAPAAAGGELFPALPPLLAARDSDLALQACGAGTGRATGQEPPKRKRDLGDDPGGSGSGSSGSGSGGSSGGSSGRGSSGDCDNENGSPGPKRSRLEDAADAADADNAGPSGELPPHPPSAPAQARPGRASGGEEVGALFFGFVQWLGLRRRLQAQRDCGPAPPGGALDPAPLAPPRPPSTLPHMPPALFQRRPNAPPLLLVLGAPQEEGESNLLASRGAHAWSRLRLADPVEEGRDLGSHLTRCAPTESTAHSPGSESVTASP